MVCPYCNTEMKEGYIQSSGLVFWGEKKHKFIFIPEEALGEVSVTVPNFTGTSAKSDYCPKCEVIISKAIKD